MVGVVGSGLSGLGCSPSQGHCVVLLGRTLYSCSTSLLLGMQMGSNPAMD